MNRKVFQFHQSRIFYCAGLVAFMATSSIGIAEASMPTKRSSRSQQMVYGGQNASSGWVPFQIYGGHIYLTAKVNGQEVSAILDSGASVIVVNALDAPRLGISASGMETGNGLQGSANSGMARAVTVAIGNFLVKSDRVAMPDLTRVVQGLHRPLTVVAVENGMMPQLSD